MDTLVPSGIFSHFKPYGIINGNEGYSATTEYSFQTHEGAIGLQTDSSADR